MRKSLELLLLLQDGVEHSGVELAKQLGVTRAAIWNHIDRLRKEGLDVRATREQGYSLSGGFEVLDTERIRGRLRQLDCRESFSIDSAMVTDSTNTALIEALSQEDIHGRVLLAEYQTAGRGRRGDRWLSPPGCGLCLSLGWRFDSPPPTFSALSLVVGLSIAESLVAAGVTRLGLKWPNDIMCNGHKLAGILIEMRSESGGASTAVIGMGINVRLSGEARKLIDQPATDIESNSEHKISRNDLAAELLQNLAQYLRSFEQHGFEKFRDSWAGFDILANALVRLESTGRNVEGIARGVDSYGALSIEHDGTVEKFMAGHLTEL